MPREMQVHYNLNMPWNRVAIPRNAMVDAAKLCEAGTGTKKRVYPKVRGKYKKQDPSKRKKYTKRCA
jgi:hypothetical protein